ncbi:MAG: CRISPR-associated endonuclease Cas3'' [Pyrobaculum sp.]
MTKCLAYRSNDGEEEFVKHVVRVLEVWKELKKYYQGGLSRAFPSVKDFDLMRYAILTHDLGKLAAHYQNNKPGDYRHEVVSAYFAYHGAAELEEEVRLTLAAAVMLHHEPIILSTYVSRLGERYLPIYVVRRALERVDLSYGCGDDVINFIKSENQSVGALLEKWRSQSLDPKEVLEVVKKIVAQFTVGSIRNLHVKRARVAAILHPLVVADSVAAHIGRGGDGTRVSKRALEGAEMLDIKELRERLL